MKKTILSTLFVGLFGLYTIAQRGTAATGILAPDTSAEQTARTVNDTTSGQSFAPVSQALPQPTATVEDSYEDDDESDVVITTPQPKSATLKPTTPTPVVIPAPKPSPVVTPTPITVTPTHTVFNDGTFTGPASNAYYGYVQVQVTTNNDRITNVAVLQYPNDRHESVKINSYALPILKSETIAAQSAQIDMVSGATDTSDAFIQSLTSALSQAHV